MQKPEIPMEEPQRLMALHELGVLDTEPCERFDRITRLAARLFHVPIVLVSLVDEHRQWFKSCLGLDVTETPRDASFCAHAILSEQMLVVEDALADVRFADNPLVLVEPKIRFYAGQPLHGRDGLRIGTLCLIDVLPRSFSAQERSLLQDLTRMIEQELSLLGDKAN